MRYALVFDIDNTLTSPRRPIEQEMVDVLMSCRVPFYLAAGSDLTMQRGQLLEPMHRHGFRGTFDAFLCNGASRYRCIFSDSLQIESIRDFSITGHLGKVASEHLIRAIHEVLDRTTFQLPDPIQIDGDQVIDRGSMINVAPIGRPTGNLSPRMFENRRLFSEFDAMSGYRRRFLDDLRTAIQGIPGCDEVVVSLGGETSFDVVIRGNDKSYAIRTLLDEGVERVIFIGDALFEGGNDEAILQFIAGWNGDHACPVEAIQVANWRETIGQLKRLGTLNA